MSRLRLQRCMVVATITRHGANQIAASDGNRSF
jgi:hypothetical protein